MREDPADPAVLEALLRRHGVRPRRRLGQSFLVDAGLRDRVAGAAGLRPGDEALEVGAGPGTLTVALAGRCQRLVAVEIDERLFRVLGAVTGGLAGLELMRADVLRLDVPALFPGGGEVVVGNIPYYLTGRLMARLLERTPRPRRLSLVVQWEVARRWTEPGQGSLGAVAVQVFARPRIEMLLPSSAFLPAPRVDSALVVMEVRERPAVEVDDMAAFFRLVAAAFRQRRKQLGGSLGRATGLGPELGQRLRAAGVDPERRPQTLEPAEWAAVYEALKALSWAER
ncbi:MAG: 16S rRNA (adenine(1518)-N(6)/adenine(1519)-N(6))-dimethyltransferase RsmA [Candidatus Dormibacterales bacterium]